MPQVIDLMKSKGKSLSLDYNISLLLSINKSKINYSIEEVSNLINLSYEFVREKIKMGKIDARTFGDRYMVHISEVARILQEGI